MSRGGAVVQHRDEARRERDEGVLTLDGLRFCLAEMEKAGDRDERIMKEHERHRCLLAQSPLSLLVDLDPHLHLLVDPLPLLLHLGVLLFPPVFSVELDFLIVGTEHVDLGIENQPRRRDTLAVLFHPFESW